MICHGMSEDTRDERFIQTEFHSESGNGDKCPRRDGLSNAATYDNLQADVIIVLLSFISRLDLEQRE